MIAGSKLEIVGKRLLLVYDPQKNAFLDFFQQDNTALRKSVGEKGYRKLRDKQQVEISLTRPQGFDETSARAAMAKIFLGPDEHISEFVPDYWKPVMRRMGGSVTRALSYCGLL